MKTVKIFKLLWCEWRGSYIFIQWRISIPLRHDFNWNFLMTMPVWHLISIVSVFKVIQKSNKVYFYITRYTIPGQPVCNGAKIGLIFNVIRQCPSGLDVAFIILRKILKACLNNFQYTGPVSRGGSHYQTKKCVFERGTRD